MSSIDPNTAGQAGQTVTPKPPTPPTPGEDLMQAMGGVLTPFMQQLGVMMQQAQGTERVGEVHNQTSIQQAEDNTNLLSGATQGQSIANPQLPNAVHADIDKFIDKFVLSLAGQDPFQGATPALTQVAQSLSNLRTVGNGGDTDNLKYTAPVQGAEAAGGAGGAGGIVPLAGLGGLVAVSLFEVLAKFAKEQSETEKMAADLTIKLHKAEIDGAHSQAQIVEEKAAIAVAALVAQMVVGVATCAIQVGGAMFAANRMNAADGASFKMSENVATTMFTPTLTAVTGAMNTLGDKGAEAIKTTMTAPLEMQEILLRAFNDMIQRASQSTDKMDSEAHDLVAQALQLLDRMLDALNQNFNKIGH